MDGISPGAASGPRGACRTGGGSSAVSSADMLPPGSLLASALGAAEGTVAITGDVAFAPLSDNRIATGTFFGEGSHRPEPSEASESAVPGSDGGAWASEEAGV